MFFLHPLYSGAGIEQIVEPLLEDFLVVPAVDRGFVVPKQDRWFTVASVSRR